MKVYILYFLGWVLLFLKPIDYRDAYCGTYTGKRIYKHLNDQKTAIISDTTSYSIVVSKNSSDSLLDIATREGKYTGKLVGASFTNQTIRFFGHFSNDSIYLDHRMTMAPPFYRYIGKK